MEIEKLVSAEVQAIFNCLQDEESKSIFVDRLEYFLTGNAAPLARVVKRAKKFPANDGDKLFNTIKNYVDLVSLKPSGTVILFGAGSGGMYIFDYLKLFEITNVVFCDTNKERWFKEYCGKTIISPQELSEKYSGCPVIISSGNYQSEIFRVLSDLHIPSENIYRCLGEEEYEAQYFGTSVLQPIDNEIYIDVGAYDGDTILDFIDWSKKRYKKIYALEADVANYNKLNNCIKENKIKNIDAIQKGAWSSAQTLKFHGAADVKSKFDNEGNIEVPVGTIDEICGRGITLIKMDIEGAELEALKGAASTIKLCRPRLAISVYHKPYDILELLIYIRNLVPEYKFYLRHHTTHSSDTVLYAII